MSSIKLTPIETPTGGIGRITPLLLPTLKQHYTRRAERLQALAIDHPMGDYLNFVASLVQAQQQVLEQQPLPRNLAERAAARIGQPLAPLDYVSMQRDSYWQQALGALLDQLPLATVAVQEVVAALRDTPPEQLEQQASALLSGHHGEVGSARALFIWAALSLYWTQLAAQLPASGHADYGEHRQFCPVCNSEPSASVVLGGAQSGLRYLHCRLCESRWHMVRAKCSNCEQTGKLDYWSLDTKEASIKAESCLDCHSYLKVLYLDRDTQLETFADDLASLILDANIEEQGFARSGLNPYLFPG